MEECLVDDSWVLIDVVGSESCDEIGEESHAGHLDVWPELDSSACEVSV